MRVLFVDDEPNVLAGLRRMLRSYRLEWELEFAGGGEEALQRMQEQPCDVVVSDMRMPGMDGARLLSVVRDAFPATVRIVLSGQSELERVMRAVGPAHQFLSKPCDAELLVTTIKRAVALHDTLSNGDLAALIASIDTLPSLPGVYEELHQIVLLDETSIDQVGALVSQDLAMTAKVLQLVNSSFFGLPHRVTEARHAVTLLGLDRVRPLAMMAGVFCQFEQTAFPVATLPRLVHHSLAVATTARRIAEVETSCNQTIEDAFLAGMLHDLGMQIFMSQLPDEYPAVIELAQTKQVPIWEAEFESFGTNHALVGAYLLSLWGLPDPVIEAIAWHHRPGQFPGASFTPLTAVHVANALQAKHSPLDPENLITQVDFAYLEQLDLTHRIPVWQGLADTIMAEEVVQ